MSATGAIPRAFALRPPSSATPLRKSTLEFVSMAPQVLFRFGSSDDGATFLGLCRINLFSFACSCLSVGLAPSLRMFGSENYLADSINHTGEGTACYRKTPRTKRRRILGLSRRMECEREVKVLCDRPLCRFLRAS